MVKLPTWNILLEFGVEIIISGFNDPEKKALKGNYGFQSYIASKVHVNSESSKMAMEGLNFIIYM